MIFFGDIKRLKHSSNSKRSFFPKKEIVFFKKYVFLKPAIDPCKGLMFLQGCIGSSQGTALVALTWLTDLKGEPIWAFASIWLFPRRRSTPSGFPACHGMACGQRRTQDYYLSIITLEKQGWTLNKYDNMKPALYWHLLASWILCIVRLSPGFHWLQCTLDCRGMVQIQALLDCIVLMSVKRAAGKWVVKMFPACSKFFPNSLLLLLPCLRCCALVSLVSRFQSCLSAGLECHVCLPGFCLPCVPYLPACLPCFAPSCLPSCLQAGLGCCVCLPGSSSWSCLLLRSSCS